MCSLEHDQTLRHERYLRALDLAEEYLIVEKRGEYVQLTESFKQTARETAELIEGSGIPISNLNGLDENGAAVILCVFQHLEKYGVPEDVADRDFEELSRIVLSVQRADAKNRLNNKPYSL